jgi:CubicO group peptidase (beta-lactamase class C family)
VAAYVGQDQRFAAAFVILQRAIAEKAFPAASVAITFRRKLRVLKALGRFTYEPDSASTATESIFDLASVSKIVATTTMAMVLYERGLLDLEMPVVSIVPEFIGGDPRRRELPCECCWHIRPGCPPMKSCF